MCPPLSFTGFSMKKRFIDYVNVFIGTAGSGHAIVGPQLPGGMVKLCPDTDRLPCAGYDYTDLKILGFSHTHTEGAGASGGRGNILLTAATGKVKTDETVYASRYSHDRETGKIGYYQVFLSDCSVDVELTCSRHTGLHRYTFCDLSDKPYIIIDIGHTLGSRNNCTCLSMQVIDPYTVCGFGEYPIIPGHHKPPYTVYYFIQFDRPAVRYGTWDENRYTEDKPFTEGTKGGGCFWFGEQARQVNVKVALSYISIEKAKENMLREIPGWDFERVVKDAQDQWEELLSRVKAEGPDEEKKIVFYSGLYRALNQPVNYEEYGEQLNLFGEGAQPSGGRGFYLDDWAIWDTFRTTHPLQTIIAPETRDDIAHSLIQIFEKGGWLPVCTSPNKGYHPEMIGHNAVSILLDAAVKGFKGFDIQKAYQAAKKTAMEYDPDLHRLGTPKEYIDLGYIPGGPDMKDDNFSVSITMEFAYADRCTAGLAKLAGYEEESQYFLNRAMNYRHLFDAKTGFARRKDKDGHWIEPFEPSDSFKRGFCECTSWEYTFFVPHDIQGLINLIGGKEAFVKKLDDFFQGEFFNYLNETSLQVPYLYVYGGAPWKTQWVVREYLNRIYKNRPDGLWGEDDAGAMSAWMVFSAMGFYPVCPGQGVYVLGSPMFPEIVIDTELKTQFVINTEHFSDQNVYVKKVLWNKEAYDKSYITHEMIKKGGVLTFVMDCQPELHLFKETPPSLTEENKQIPLNMCNIDLNPPSLKFYNHTYEEIETDGLGPVSEEYAVHKTTEAFCYQKDNKIFIYSRGNMSRSEYGMVYKKTPVAGDFTAEVTLELYDLSSPYAPSGIIISSCVTDVDIYGLKNGDIVAGAMAKRGYYLYGTEPDCTYPTGYQYAKDCPKPGCRIKVTKIGNQVTAYYRENDSDEWVLINRVYVKDKNALKYVGVYQGSNSPDLRLVVFKNFEVNVLE